MQQQQQQAQAQQTQDAHDRVSAMQNGWVSADALTKTSSGLIDRTQPAQPNQDPGRIQVIGGQRMYKKTDAEQNAEKGETFVPGGQLGDALKTAGWDGKTAITPQQSHTLMQALHAAQPEGNEPYNIDTSGKFKDARGNAVPVTIGQKTGVVRPLDLSGGSSAYQQQKQGPIPAGTMIPTAGSGQQTQFAIDKPDKADSQQILEGLTGPNGGKVVYDKNTQKTFEVLLPTGSKPSLNAAQTEADADRHAARNDRNADRADRKADRETAREDRQAKPPSPAQLRMVTTAKQKALAKANDEYQEATSPVGGPGGLPASETDKANAAKVLRQAHVQAQTDYEDSLGTLTGKQVEHNDWADRALTKTGKVAAQPANAPAAKVTAQPAAVAAKVAAQPAAAAAPSPAKKFTASQISDWAKKNGKDPADALKRAKANGLI